MNKEAKKRKLSKYNYHFGDVHPGVVAGHKKCNPFAKPGYLVPPTMGWLWNTDVPGFKYRRGWQPGIIGNTVAQMMTFKCPRISNEKKKEQKLPKKKKKNMIDGGGGGGDSEPEEPLTPKPALKVKRKGDIFTIEVNPLKDLTEINPNEDPYVDCDPLIFKIIKKRSPEDQAKAEAKKMVRLKRDRDAEVRKALAEAVEDICKCAYMDVYCNDLTAIDNVIDTCPAFKEPDCVCHEESLSSLSSNASWDIEYTPPFGCFDLAPRKRLRCIHVFTQYDPVDIGLEPKLRCKKSCCSFKTKPLFASKKKVCCPQCRK